MKKRVYLIAAVVSGALAVSGCTTNPYTGDAKQVNLLSAQVWALSWARYWCAIFFEERSR
ncbi:putative outer membrane protein [Escherichia coli]|uniref:Putative outer membrane protein n=1 Tax=Escherichia coli TaxID=562 RepID=A0A377AND3_ECOLX|nr:putative outer membrane protein [Escherichia coli]